MSGFASASRDAVSGVGRARAGRDDAQPGMRSHHAIAGRAGDTRRATDKRDAVGAALSLGKVRVDEVRTPDPYRLGMAPATQRAHDPDAVGDEHRGRLEQRREVSVAPRQHHHLGVERDHHAQGTPWHRGDVARRSSINVRTAPAMSTTSTGHPSTRALAVSLATGGEATTAWCTAAPSELV